MPDNSGFHGDYSGISDDVAGKPEGTFSKLRSNCRHDSSDSMQESHRQPGTCYLLLFTRYLFRHPVGSHFEPSGSFLKFVLVTNGSTRYLGSSTTVVTTNQMSPFRSFDRS